MQATTSSRLRKTFKYAIEDDSDGDDLPEAMDEEEQETLIRNLRLQNDSLNKTYTHILLLLPLVSTLPYLLRLQKTHTLLSLLSISSLLSTAYIVYQLPPELTGIRYIDNLAQQMQNRKSIPREDGPIRQYLPILNIGLCVVLLWLGALVNKEGGWMVLTWLPAGVYTVVLLGKWVMAGVDPERDLGQLRYIFKGA